MALDLIPAGELDAGIAPFVDVLRGAGVETFESCEGGVGHCSPEPFVRFHGNKAAGFRALQVALDHALPVLDLQRYWSIIDGELTGPFWKMTFLEKADGTDMRFWWNESVPSAWKVLT
jgi:hypothetical protein